jgi:hypothetical protein
MIPETQYIDVNLTSLKLSFEGIGLDDHTRKVCLRFYIIDEKRDEYHCHVFRIKNHMRLTADKLDEMTTHYASMENRETPFLLFNCVIDLILNNEWKVDEDTLSKNGSKLHDFLEDDKYAKHLRINENRIEYTLSPLNLIRQNRLVQRAILNTLFLKSMES